MSLMSIAELDELAAQHERITLVPAPTITKRDARNRMLGMMKMIVFFSGGDTRDAVDPMDFMVRRVDQLEDETAYLKLIIEKLEAEKIHYRKSEQEAVAGYKKALRNIAVVLEPYRKPFDLLPFSKWKNKAKGEFMLAVGETVDWAVQRAENQLDPTNAVVIAADQEV